MAKVNISKVDLERLMSELAAEKEALVFRRDCFDSIHKPELAKEYDAQIAGLDNKLSELKYEITVFR